MVLNGGQEKKSLIVVPGVSDKTFFNQGVSIKRKKMKNQTIKINEVFESISGEICPYGQGLFTTFIRLSGCTTGKCPYCDTNHSRYDEWDVEGLVNHIVKTSPFNSGLCITGGEPLEQKEAFEDLIEGVNQHGWRRKIWVETNGIVEIPDLHSEVHYVMDYKFHNKPNPKNYGMLTTKSSIKFLIDSRENFNEMIAVLNSIDTDCKNIAVGTLWEGEVTPKELVKWMWEEIRELNDFNFYLNTQVHKFIDIK